MTSILGLDGLVVVADIAGGLRREGVLQQLLRVGVLSLGGRYHGAQQLQRGDDAIVVGLLHGGAGGRCCWWRTCCLCRV